MKGTFFPSLFFLFINLFFGSGTQGTISIAAIVHSLVLNGQVDFVMHRRNKSLLRMQPGALFGDSIGLKT